VSIAANTGAFTYKVSFCVYNREAGTKTNFGFGGTLFTNPQSNKSGFNIPGCKTYTADNIAGNTCAAADTSNGWSGPAGAGALAHATLANGFPVITGIPCKLGSYDATASKCTACNTLYYLTTAGACASNISGCLVQTTASPPTCTTPVPGYLVHTTNSLAT